MARPARRAVSEVIFERQLLRARGSSGSGGPAGYILWAGTVGFSPPLAERFAATAATGCRRATLSPPDVLRAAQSGTTAAEIGRQAADFGLGLVMDPVTNWYPDRLPSPSRFAESAPTKRSGCARRWASPR